MSFAILIKADDYSKTKTVKRLKPGAIPSVFAFTKARPVSAKDRRRNRRQTAVCIKSSSCCEGNDLLIGREEIIDMIVRLRERTLEVLLC